MKTSKLSVEKYIWGDNCEAWPLLMSKELSVIQESMPANTAETLHFHKKSQQFFYILSGTATFIIDNIKYSVLANENITIFPNQKHIISNKSNQDLTFLVISQPNSRGDRFEINNNQ